MIIFREKLEYKVIFKLYNGPTNFHDQNEALRALSIVNRLLNIVKSQKKKTIRVVRNPKKAQITNIY